MPRIRKKTSKRGTTRHRESIKHKISGHLKKSKKQARKDKASGKVIQKKSKKDPGIPNAFPYKDQILAEVAEQRREAAAERQRRKEEKRAAAAVAAGEDVDATTSDVEEPTPADIDLGENDGQGFDGIMSLRPAPVPKNKNKESGDAIKDRKPSIPVTPGPRTLREVVEKADVVLHVVDARDPLAGMSEAIHKAAKDKLVVLVNKADMVPRESVARWLVHLRTSYTALPFRVSSAFIPSATPFEPPNTKAKPMLMDDALGLKGLWAHLDSVAQKAKKNEELVVAVTGITNAGKSAVINSILGSDVLSIYSTYTAGSAKGPYTTTKTCEVVAMMPGNETRKVRFVDTPGLEYARSESWTDQEKETIRARDILLRCRGRIDRLKDPLFVVTDLVSRADTQDLMLAYGLPAFLQGDASGFLAGLARVSGLIKKRGVLDHAGAARILLRDWITGKLMRYSLPEGKPAATEGVDEEVLGALRGRKDLRTAADVKLVKMKGSGVDPREVEWDVGWGDDEDEESNEASSDGDDGGDEVDDGGEDGGDESESAGVDETVAAVDRKRKVTFRLGPDSRKRRRAAGR